MMLSFLPTQHALFLCDDLNCKRANPSAKLSCDFTADVKERSEQCLAFVSSKANTDRFETHDLMPCWARKMAYSEHRFPA